MFKTEFRRIADKENGKFYYEDKDIDVGLGVRSPNVTYVIKFEYKENSIMVYNRTGTAFTGEIVCILPSISKITPFEISTVSHLSNLFIRKKSRLKIKTKNKNINYFFKHNNAFNKLDKIVKKENFSPSISTPYTNNKQEIVTKYHLEFDNWTQVIEPIIELYKNLADEFKKKGANISEH